MIHLTAKTFVTPFYSAFPLLVCTFILLFNCRLTKQSSMLLPYFLVPLRYFSSKTTAIILHQYDLILPGKSG